MFAFVGLPPETPWMLLFALVIGHAVADFPLQGAFLAQGKNRHLNQTVFPGEEPKGIWVYCLTAHSLIQAGGVWIVTGSFVIALIEFVVHWLLDFAKCENWTNFHVDQFAHILCKIAYVLILFSPMADSFR